MVVVVVVVVVVVIYPHMARLVAARARPVRSCAAVSAGSGSPMRAPAACHRDLRVYDTAPRLDAAAERHARHIRHRVAQRRRRLTTMAAKALAHVLTIVEMSSACPSQASIRSPQTSIRKLSALP